MDGGQFEIVKETVQTFTKPRNEAARFLESNIMGNMDYSMEMSWRTQLQMIHTRPLFSQSNWSVSGLRTLTSRDGELDQDWARIETERYKVLIPSLICQDWA